MAVQDMPVCFLYQLKAYGIMAHNAGRIGYFVLPDLDDVKRPLLGYVRLWRDKSATLILELLLDERRANVGINQLVPLQIGRLRALIWQYIRGQVPVAQLGGFLSEYPAEDRPVAEGYRRRDIHITAPMGYLCVGAEEVLQDLALNRRMRFVESSVAKDAVTYLIVYLCNLITTTTASTLHSESCDVIAGCAAMHLLGLVSASTRITDVALVDTITGARVPFPVFIHCNGFDDGQLVDKLRRYVSSRTERRRIATPLRFLMLQTLYDHHTLFLYDEKEDLAVHCDSLSSSQLSGSHYERAMQWTSILSHHRNVRRWPLPAAQYQRARECGMYALAAVSYFSNVVSLGEALRTMTKPDFDFIGTYLSPAIVLATQVLTCLRSDPVRARGVFLDALLRNLRGENWLGPFMLDAT